MDTRPKAKDILENPSYPYTIWKLVPTQEGRLPVAQGRGGPFNISWEVHGEGDTKLVWVMGLGAIKSAWQRQTLKFGHEMGDKYSCLVYDNRGMGESDKPLMRYSTSEMARDVLEILEHIGWTSQRQLHVIGVSMGGMIAQELGLLIPDRICSLNLISTAAAIENTTTFVENLRNRINMFIPKSLDRSLQDVSKSLFAEEWLDRPDDAVVPTADTPKVILPPSGAYPKFKTNYERWGAQELQKRLDSEAYQRKGFMLQAIAAGWHHKSAAQLKELGDKIGRERISVLHGTLDNMITVYHGKKLIELLNPGVGIIKEGFGHVFMMEDTQRFNELMEEQVKKTEVMSKE
ncbi:Alpha/Beta hydrolase protein [Xylogone sp. PMI_703]|nr:Alpha/Beta hydrolase protein [Xylogone sp. PMI_703]